jgi:hypothetical protein
MSRKLTPLDAWTREERALHAKLKTPERIQQHLDDTPYSTDSFYRSPRSVMRDKRAHCFDGACLAATAFERHGGEPLLVDLRSVRDDDHVIAIFKRWDHFGAVAKSNCVGLRYREPIYRSLRELVMSYFDDYYNLAGEKTLRAFSVPLDLRRFDKTPWRFHDEPMNAIAEKLDDIRHEELLTKAMIRGLAPTDPRSFKAGLLGSNPAGLYQVKKPA